MTKPQLEPWQHYTGKWNDGAFIGPLPEWELREAQYSWRLMRGSDYHEGVKFDTEFFRENVQEELWDLLEHFGLPITNNGVGRTYHYIMSGDLEHEIIEAFKRQGWTPPPRPV